MKQKQKKFDDTEKMNKIFFANNNNAPRKKSARKQLDKLQSIVGVWFKQKIETTFSLDNI